MFSTPTTETMGVENTVNYANSRKLARSALFDQLCRLDAIQSGKIPRQILFPLEQDSTLLGQLAVFAIDRRHRFHPLEHSAEGHKTQAVKIRVVSEIDKYLGRAATRPLTGSKRYRTPRIVAMSGLIGYRRPVPARRDLGSIVETKLHQSSSHYPEKALAIEKTVPD